MHGSVHVFKVISLHLQKQNSPQKRTKHSFDADAYRPWIMYDYICIGHVRQREIVMLFAEPSGDSLLLTLYNSALVEFEILIPSGPPLSIFSESYANHTL